MQENQPYITLNNGYKIPQIGLGTSRIIDQEGKKAIKTAIIEVGYRQIDTASLYQNQLVIGEVLEECFLEGLKREDIFITSKLWVTDFENPQKSIKDSLSKLKLEYLDLYLIHWPLKPYDPTTGSFKKIPLYKTWQKMEELVKKGFTKSIGVSNFNVQLSLDLLSYAEINPVINQIEAHPYLTQYKAVEWFKKMGICVQAYAPLLAPNKSLPYHRADKKNLFEEPVIAELAVKYQKTKAQIILNWGLQRGHIILPKSSTKSRQIQNLLCYNFKLQASDVKKINELDCGERSHDLKYSQKQGSVPVFQ